MFDSSLRHQYSKGNPAINTVAGFFVSRPMLGRMYDDFGNPTQHRAKENPHRWGWAGAKQRFLPRGGSLRRPCGPLPKPHHSPHSERVPRAICVNHTDTQATIAGCFGLTRARCVRQIQVFSGSGTAHRLQCRAWAMRALECPPRYLSVSSSCAVDSVRTVPRTASSRTCCFNLRARLSGRGAASCFWLLSDRPLFARTSCTPSIT